MANFTGLAGAAGLAAALEHIQGRRIKEAQLQKELTAGQGEWTPMQSGMGGGVGGFFDALLGHNRPGQIGFGGQRYEFQPYAQVTPEEATAWGMTYPEERKVPGLDAPSLNLAAPGTQPGFGAPAAKLAAQTPGMTFGRADTTAYPFTPIQGPDRTITEEKPLPGIVGMRLGPKEKMALFQDQLKARREEAKQKRELAMIQSFGTQGESTYQGGTTQPGGTVIPDEMLPEGVAPSGKTPPAAATPAPSAASAQPSGASANKAAKGAPLGTPTPAINAAVTEATRLYPQVSAQRITSIIAQESNFDHTAVSPKKAKGLMQLMDGTAKDMGVDDPFDVMQNVRGGTRYYAELLTKYGGDERKALAAYNWGPGNLDGVGGDVSKSPASVQAYVGRVLAGSGSSGTATAQTAPKAPAASVSAQAPASASASAPAPAPAPAPAATDPATQTYVTQFQQGSEADARKVIVAAEGKANPKNPADQATILAMKRAVDTVFPRGQAQAPAQSDTSMQVAGPSAPAPKPVQPVVSPPPGQKAATSPAPAPGQTGTGATGTPATATTPTVPATATTSTAATAQATTEAPPVQQPFRLSMPGYQQIQANNATITKNEAAMRQLQREQRQAYALAATTKNTQWATHATSLGGRIADLERSNTNLREQNTQTLSKEQESWRTRGAEEQKNYRESQEGRVKEERVEKREIDKEGRGVKREIDQEGRMVKITIDKEGREVKREIEKEGRLVQITIDREGREVQHEIDKEGRHVAITIDKEGREVKREIEKEERKPNVEANVTTAVQDAEMTEPLRFTKQDLVAQGVAPDKPWKDYTTPEKAAVTREHVARQNEIKSIENMEVFDRTALYAIAKRDGTPIGRVTKEQLAEARQQGAVDRQQNAKDLEVAKAQGKMDGPIGESDALKYINPKTGRPADPLETPRQAMARGDMLMDKPQQKTIMNAQNSMRYVNRLHTLYFGGKDDDGSITGTVGADFEGIYPSIEKFHKENQSLPARMRNTMALRTGILAGKPIAQWAATADNFIKASLGQISRDLGGERGHFTDADAERAQGFFAKLGTRWWGESAFNPNFMTPSNVARNQLRLVTGVMSDRVRGALNLRPSDQLPWDTFGRIMPEGQTEPAPPRPPTPEAPVPAAARQAPPQGTPAAPAPQTPVPAAPVAVPVQPAPPTPVPVPAQQAAPPPTQETVPASQTAQPPPQASVEEDPEALARYRQQFAGKSRVEVGELAATIWRSLPDGPERRAMEAAAREALPAESAQAPVSAQAPEARQQTPKGAPKKLDGPTAQRHMQQALGALFPGRTVQSLSHEEKQQLLQGARQVGAEAGYTP